ncbi:MAG: DUF5074 domain-containing protein, partial [Candidatus Aphodosoma sp.]
MRKNLFFSAMLLLISFFTVSAQQRSVQMPPHARIPALQSHVRSAENAEPFSFQNIIHWVGNGENEAALVVQFNDGKGDKALVWGYRWDGTASGEDMVRAIGRASKTLSILVQYTGSMGCTLDGIGVSKNRQLVNNLYYDADGASASAQISFGFGQPNATMGQTSAPTVDEARALCTAAITASGTTGIITHPLDQRTYGYPSYDYDFWKLTNDAPADCRWSSGWYDGYWSFWVGDDAGNMSYSGLGMSSSQLTDGSINWWNYNSNMSGHEAPALATEFDYSLSGYDEQITEPAEGPQIVDFSKINYWVGSGEKYAAVVVKFNDNKGPENIVFGVRWTGGWDKKVSEVEDMLLAGDSRFNYEKKEDGSLKYIKYDSNDDGQFNWNDHNATNGTWNTYAWFRYGQEIQQVTGDNYITPKTVLILTNGTDTGLDYLLYRPVTDTPCVLLPEKISYSISNAVLRIPAYIQKGTATSMATTGTWSVSGDNISEILSVSGNQLMGNVSFLKYQPCNAGITLSVDMQLEGADATAPQLSNTCLLDVLAPEKPVTSLNIEGVVDGGIVEIPYKGLFGIHVTTEPEDASLSGFNLSIEHDSIVREFGTGKYEYPYLVAYGVGETNVTVTSKDGNAAVSFTARVLDMDDSERDFTDGTFILNEDWFGHTNGSMNYMPDDTSMLYRVVSQRNEGVSFGCTSQFGMIYADKLIVTSKQHQDGGDPNPGGGRLTILNAQTLKILAKFDTYPDGGDGRACVGINPHKIYVGSTGGIYPFSLDSLKFIGNTAIPGTRGASLYSGQTGDMVKSGNYVYAAKQSDGVLVIDCTADTLVKTIRLKGIISVARTKDGNVWIGENKKFHRIDQNTLEIAESYDMPNNTNISGGGFWSWGSWRPAQFFGSNKENRLFFGFYSWEVGTDISEAKCYLDGLASLPGDNNKMFYGVSRLDERTGEVIVMTVKGYGYSAVFNTYHRVDYKTGEVKSTFIPDEGFWFQSMPVFPDKYEPVVNLDEIMVNSRLEGKDIPLANYVSDLDVNYPQDFTYMLYTAGNERIEDNTHAVSIVNDTLHIDRSKITTAPQTFILSAENNGREVKKEFSVVLSYDKFFVDLSVNNAAMGTVSGGGYINDGFECTITATANPGYKFVQWSDGNTENPRTITVTEDMAITAEFEASEYTVTVNSADESMGTVAVEPAKESYLYGETVTVSADPNPGYKFVQWSDGNTENPR